MSLSSEEKKMYLIVTEKNEFEYRKKSSLWDDLNQQVFDANIKMN